MSRFSQAPFATLPEISENNAKRFFFLMAMCGFLSLVASLFSAASKANDHSPVSLDWQPESMYSWDGSKETRIRFKAAPKASELNNKAGYSGQAHIIANPFQRLTICADSVSSEDAAIIAAESAYIVILQGKAASINIYAGKPCIQSLQYTTENQYNWRRVLFSDAPFMVRVPDMASQKLEKNQETGFVLPSISFPDTPEETNLLSGFGGGVDSDDNFKRPPFMAMPLKGDFDLRILPVLRRSSNWLSTLPGNQLSHWLWGEPDYDSDITLLLRFEHYPAVQIRVSHTEYQELAGLLSNPKQILRWLATKLSGREAFIQQLLNLQTELENHSVQSSELAPETHEAIEAQLALVLEQPDTEFSLELETQYLTAAISDFVSIIQAHGGDKSTNKKGQTDNPGKNSQSSASSGSSADKSDSRIDNPRKETSDNNPPSEDPKDTPRSKITSAPPDVYVLNVNGETFWLSAEKVDRKLLFQSDVKRIKVHSPKGIQSKNKRRHDIRLSKVENKCDIPESSRLPGNAKAIDFLLLYGTEESAQKLHQRHLNQGIDLPEDELAKASHSIIAALHGRRFVLDKLVYKNQPPLDEAIERNLPVCLEYLLEKGFRPSGENGEARLIHLAVTSRNDESTGFKLSTDILGILLSYWSEAAKAPLADGTTALHTALQLSDVEALELLFQYVSNTEESGLRAELLAQIPVDLNSEKREQLTRILELSNPETDNNFARFITAVKQQNPGAAKNFVKYGVDRTKRWNDKTALQIAVEAGDSAMVSSLLTYLNDLPAEAGAEVCEQTIGDTSEGSKGYEILNAQTELGSPLHIAVLLDQSTVEALDNAKEIIRELMFKKADINLRRKSDGATPLFLAAETGNFKVVSLLLERKQTLDLNACRETDGATPLFIAVEHSHANVVRQLLTNGADASLPKRRINEDGGERYPLLTAYINGQQQIPDSSLIFNLLVFNSDKVLDQLDLAAHHSAPSHSSPEYLKAVRVSSAFEELAAYNRDALKRTVGDKTVLSVYQKAATVVGKLHGVRSSLEHSVALEPEPGHETSIRDEFLVIQTDKERTEEPEKKVDTPLRSLPASTPDMSQRPIRSWWCILCSRCCPEAEKDDSEVSPLLNQ